MTLLIFLADERTQNNRDVTIAIAATVSATTVVVIVIVCLGYVYYIQKVKEIRNKITMRKIIDNKNRNDMTDIPEKLTTLDDYFRKYETDVAHVFATLQSEETETESSKGYKIVNVLDVMFTTASERKRALDMLQVPEKVKRIYVDGDMSEYESNLEATFSDLGESPQETSFENESDSEPSLFGDHINTEADDQTIFDFSDQIHKEFKNQIHSDFDDQTQQDVENQIHSDFGDETNTEFQNQIHSDFGDHIQTNLSDQMPTNFNVGIHESFDNQVQTEYGDQMQAYKVLYNRKPDFQTLEKKEQPFSDKTKLEACKKDNRTKHKKKNKLPISISQNSNRENSLVSKKLKVHKRKQTKILKKTIRENCNKCPLQNVSSAINKNRRNFMATHSTSDLQEPYIVSVKEKRSRKLKQKTAATSRTSTATSRSSSRHRTLSRASNHSQPLETFVSVSEIGLNI